MRGYEVVPVDVLVIGGGGAGSRAAIAADSEGASVYMVVKGLFGHSGCTPVALGGYAAAFGNADPRDSWRVHFEDTCIGGGMLNNQELVEVLCKESPERFKELESYGAIFDRDNNHRYYQRQLGGHSYPRTCTSGDRTGGEMMKGLANEVYRREIRVMQDCTAIRLLKEDGRVVGCLAYEMKRGKFLVFRAKSTILANGGSGQVFKFCFAPYQKAGDANRMALEAGAELVDLEMFQFHPTGYIAPGSIAGQSISEGVRGEGGRLYNVLGERFMERYNPKQLELGCRDFISRCIYFELKEGRGTEDGAVFLSMTHVPGEIIEQRLTTMLMRGLNYGVDIRVEPMRIYPSSHYQNGGIRIDMNWKTKVDHLYAAGESAGGVHGANRLGSNSLPDLLVSGKIAGEHATRAALGSYKPVDMANFKEEVERAFGYVEDIVSTDNGVNPISIRNEIKDLVWNNVGIARSEGTLTHAIEVFEDMKKNRLPRVGDRGRSYSIEFLEALDVRSMICSGECMARGGLLREESRCGHFREDYPVPKDEWTANIIYSLDGDGQLVLRKEPIVQTILDPKKVEMPIFPTHGRLECGE